MLRRMGIPGQEWELYAEGDTRDRHRKRVEPEQRPDRTVPVAEVYGTEQTCIATSAAVPPAPATAPGFFWPAAATSGGTGHDLGFALGVLQG